MRADSHWNSNAPANGSLMDPAFLRQVVDDSNPAFRAAEQKHAAAAHLWQAWLARAHALRVWATGGTHEH